MAGLAVDGGGRLMGAAGVPVQIMKAEGQLAFSDFVAFMRDHGLEYCAGLTDGCPQPCRFLVVDRCQDELYALCDDHALELVSRYVDERPRIYHFVDRSGLMFWLAHDPATLQ